MSNNGNENNADGDNDGSDSGNDDLMDEEVVINFFLNND